MFVTNKEVWKFILDLRNKGLTHTKKTLFIYRFSKTKLQSTLWACSDENRAEFEGFFVNPIWIYYVYNSLLTLICLENKVI